MALNQSQLKVFADYIQNEIGIVYTSENYFQLEARISDICKSLSLPSEEALLERVQGGLVGVQKQLVLDVATNNETSFFRDPKAFRAIEQLILPEIRKQNQTLPVIRIWCAASSFGQEPYSLAMLLSEMAEKDPTLPRVEIVATDISDSALSRAKEGRYSQLEVQRGLPAALLVKYFTKSEDDYWTIKPELRVMVQYKQQNLLESFAALGTFELVLCRNVLIYQTEAKKGEIVREVTQRITPRGFLLLGSAESLFGISRDFDQLLSDGSILFQKK